jgi:hypothetical protein
MGRHGFQRAGFNSVKISTRKGFAASAPVALALLGLLLFTLSPGAEANPATAAITAEDSQKLNGNLMHRIKSGKGKSG